MSRAFQPNGAEEIDFRALRVQCEGKLGWTRERFLLSTLEDVHIALEGYEVQIQEYVHLISILAAYLSNALPGRIAQAMNSKKRLKVLKPTDFFDPDRKAGKTKGMSEAEKEYWRIQLARMPKTIPDHERAARPVKN